MPTAKELLDYSERLNNAVLKDENEIFFNDSILHAMIIMKELFNKAAKEEPKKVCMFCGEFSLFRDETKIKIENEKNRCSLEGLNERERELWAKIDFYEDLKESFLNFISNSSSRFELILQSGIDSLKNQTIWNSLRNDRIKVYIPILNLGLDHFATTTKAYRVENSDTIKTATCCFNDRDSAEILNDCFRELIKYSKPLSII